MATTTPSAAPGMRGGSSSRATDLDAVEGSPSQPLARLVLAFASVAATEDASGPLPPPPPLEEEVDVLGGSGPDAVIASSLSRLLVVSPNLAQRALGSIQKADRLLSKLRQAVALVEGIRARAVREEVESPAAVDARRAPVTSSVSAFAAAQWQLAHARGRFRRSLR